MRIIVGKCQLQFSQNRKTRTYADDAKSKFYQLNKLQVSDFILDTPLSCCTHKYPHRFQIVCGEGFSNEAKEFIRNVLALKQN